MDTSLLPLRLGATGINREFAYLALVPSNRVCADDPGDLSAAALRQVMSKMSNLTQNLVGPTFGELEPSSKLITFPRRTATKRRSP